MNFKKADSLIRCKERASHKQTLPMGRPNPNKSGRAKKTSKNGVALNKLLDGYALKELKEVGWPKQTLKKGMN